MKNIFNFSLILLILSLNDIEADISNDNYEITSKALTLKRKMIILSGLCTECQLNATQKIEMKIILNSFSIDNANTGPFINGK